MDLDWLSVWMSLKVAALCLVLITPPGLAAGWILARKRFPGKALFEALVYAPLVLPPVVTGYLLLVVWGRKGVLGRWLEDWLGWQVAFNFSGAVLAAAVVAFPLLVRAFRLAVELIDPGLEIAAATLGASPARVFATVTMPLATPGLVTGLLLAFVRGLGEFGATITFAGNIAGETRTLPLAVYTYLQIPGKEGAVWALTLVSLALALAALVCSELFARHWARQVRGRA